MTKFTAPPSPETRVFSCIQAAGNLETVRRLAARTHRRAAVEAPMTETQRATLATYSEPRYTQGGVPCGRAK